MVQGMYILEGKEVYLVSLVLKCSDYSRLWIEFSY